MVTVQHEYSPKGGSEYWIHVRQVAKNMTLSADLCRVSAVTQEDDCIHNYSIM